MRRLVAFLIVLLAGCSQAEAPSFTERVERAEQLEKSPTGIAFLTQVMNHHGDDINGFVGTCYASNTALERDVFVLVTDIDQSGQFTNIAVQPETDASRCYAARIAALRTAVALPDGFEDEPFPVVLKVTYNK